MMTRFTGDLLTVSTSCPRVNFCLFGMIPVHTRELFSVCFDLIYQFISGKCYLLQLSVIVFV